MEYNEFTKQMVGFHKTMLDTTMTIFNGSVNSVILFQEQMRKSTDMFWEHFKQVPEKRQTVYSEWNEIYEKACGIYTQLFEDYFKVVESSIPSGGNGDDKPEAPKATTAPSKPEPEAPKVATSPDKPEPAKTESKKQ
jgi:hypothetical protein